MLAKLLATTRRRPVDLALVLGSGLGALAKCAEVEWSAPFAAIAGLAAPTVPEHRGIVAVGRWAGRRLLIFEGRLHYYEGHSWEQIEQLVRLAHQLGVRRLLLTNAAGGIRADLEPGCFLTARDHVEWTQPYCWRLPGPGALGPSRPAPYSPSLRGMLRAAAAGVGVALPEGVYAAVTGPNFETPAEIRALAAWGADAVGMSTTREAACAAELGMQCAALSCITNRAAGLSSGPITNTDVLVTAAAQCDRLAAVLEAFLRSLE